MPGHALSRCATRNDGDMSVTTWFVTGASRGFGRELTGQLQPALTGARRVGLAVRHGLPGLRDTSASAGPREAYGEGGGRVFREDDLAGFDDQRDRAGGRDAADRIAADHEQVREVAGLDDADPVGQAE